MTAPQKRLTQYNFMDRLKLSTGSIGMPEMTDEMFTRRQLEAAYFNSVSENGREVDVEVFNRWMLRSVDKPRGWFETTDSGQISSEHHMIDPYQTYVFSDLGKRVLANCIRQDEALLGIGPERSV